MKYVISKYIQFLSPARYLNSQAEKNALNHIIINDNNSGRTFLINETIETFIKKFTLPKSFKTVAEEIAAEINLSVNEVEKLIVPFFKYIKYRHFIVSEKNYNKEDSVTSLLVADALLDQYKIEKILAVNRNMDVCHAIDLKTEMPVIIKLLKQPAGNDVQELIREYDFLSKLNNTSVTPKSIFLSQAKEPIYFVQEYIEGLSMPQFIDQNKNSTPAIILSVAERVLKAFGEIHKKNIIHGDIHPSNIIVTTNNQIKIIDFGLAINAELDKNELVNFGGAYFFMPPERIKKASYKKFTRKPDFYSDVFQLGVILYMLFFDAYPFNGITWEELATEIKEKEISIPRKTCYGFILPDWIKEIIAKAVAKNPKERFNNAQKMYPAFLVNRSTHGSKTRSAIKV